jgi:hypothetical protein
MAGSQIGSSQTPWSPSEHIFMAGAEPRKDNLEFSGKIVGVNLLANLIVKVKVT